MQTSSKETRGRPDRYDRVNSGLKPYSLQSLPFSASWSSTIISRALYNLQASSIESRNAPLMSRSSPKDNLILPSLTHPSVVFSGGKNCSSSHVRRLAPVCLSSKKCLTCSRLSYCCGLSPNFFLLSFSKVGVLFTPSSYLMFEVISSHFSGMPSYTILLGSLTFHTSESLSLHPRKFRRTDIRRCQRPSFHFLEDY